MQHSSDKNTFSIVTPREKISGVLNACGLVVSVTFATYLTVFEFTLVKWAVEHYQLAYAYKRFNPN